MGLRTRTTNPRKLAKKARLRAQRAEQNAKLEVGKLTGAMLLVKAPGKFRDLSLHAEAIAAKDRQLRQVEARAAREDKS